MEKGGLGEETKIENKKARIHFGGIIEGGVDIDIGQKSGLEIRAWRQNNYTCNINIFV